MHDTPTGLAIIAGAFLLAGAVKGVIGMGLPTVAMGLLGLVMPPVQAAALLVVPSLATNVWQMLAGPVFGAAVKRFGGGAHRLDDQTIRLNQRIDSTPEATASTAATAIASAVISVSLRSSTNFALSVS